MLDENLIIKSPRKECLVPESISVGEYFVECIKKRNPDDIFCIDGITDESLTCAKILDKIFKTVLLLRKQGVKQLDVVGIVSENCIEYCIAVLAIYYSGCACNFLNPVYTTGELQRILGITKPKLVFCSKSTLQKLDSIQHEGNTSTIQTIVLRKDSNNDTPHELTLEDYLESIVLNEEVRPPEDYCNSQTINILLSSGTTGLPKCLMISESNLKFGISSLGNHDCVRMGLGDSVLAVLPFCHIFGGSTISVAALYSVKLVILPSFQSKTFLSDIQKYKITTLCAVPPMLSFIAQHPAAKAFDLTSVKTVISGGNSLKLDILNKCGEALPNAEITTTYGLSEFSGMAIMCPRNIPLRSKLDAVGVLVPNAEAIVWDLDLKKYVGPLKKGEICLRGPLVMKGYMNETSKDIDENGFLHTGDVGYYDENQFFYIVGRIKELIKYKGFQVAPVEVENLLLTHEGVQECAVAGTPDERAGQLPTAFIVKKPNANVTEKEIIEYVAERISIHKQLHGGVKFVPALPKNSLGKVLRTSLLEMYNTT